MKRTWVKVVCITLALVLCGAGLTFAQKAKKAAPEMNVTKMLMDAFDLTEKGKYDKAEKVLEKILQKEPGNPLALNNMAAIMVKKKKFDKADTLLNQALPKAQGYMVQVNRVCAVGGICMAFKPVTAGTGNQELAPMIKVNIDMVKQLMRAEPVGGTGPRPK
ncbi:MAG: tetratricopeptide repeat protein [Thermodesulfobacteriota bacterium]